ncbi:MAG: HAD family hydrolase [candidate division KSB1 bacterium]|nr:HAD family hydrolase [candidate division KSB1 bacterium]
MINFIFFDIGNVILNDDPAMALVYQMTYQSIRAHNIEITFEDLLREREKLILNEHDGNHHQVLGIKYLGKKYARERKRQHRILFANWSRYAPLIPGIVPVIRELSSRYRLGLLANQPPQALDVLEEHHLLQYFEVRGISSLVGLMKPDPQFFQWALKEANCQPQETIMVGDRLDNDIAPAKALGMKTLWLSLTWRQKSYQPAEDYEKLYFQSLERASMALLPPRNELEQPDCKAVTFEDILVGIERITK